MVRPHDDLRDHDEVPDPQETIHFLRQSNEQWQATAERIARQRDAAIATCKQIDEIARDNELMAAEAMTEIQNVLSSDY